MRVIKYGTRLDDDRKPMLVKEGARNYTYANSCSTPRTIAKLMNDVFDADVQTEEHVWVLALDTKNKLKGIFEISHGLVDSALVTPREVFMKLCLIGASSFVLVHNHPSGDTEPSQQDNSITENIKGVGALMNIRVLDHIIIGNEPHHEVKIYSYAEEGKL